MHTWPHATIIGLVAAQQCMLVYASILYVSAGNRLCVSKTTSATVKIQPSHSVGQEYAAQHVWSRAEICMQEATKYHQR